MGQDDIRRQYRHAQEKYVYYIIALCVAAIGFSVHKTAGQPLKWTHVPIALAVSSWSVAVHFGLKFVGYSITALWKNNALLDVTKGIDPIVGKDPGKIRLATEALTTGFKTIERKAQRAAKYQRVCIYIGFLLFIVWHVLEMYYQEIHVH